MFDELVEEKSRLLQIAILASVKVLNDAGQKVVGVAQNLVARHGSHLRRLRDSYFLICLPRRVRVGQT